MEALSRERYYSSISVAARGESRPPWIWPMVPKVDHYVPLLRAVASLDRTSYEARGAIYDRALAIVVERLGATVPPPSQADIDQELLAFRAAVRRIEFGDMDAQDRDV